MTPLDSTREERNRVILTDEHGTEFVASMNSVARMLGPARMGDLLTNYVNCFGHEREAQQFAEAMEQAHPTLQALAVKFLLNVVRFYEPKYTDQRNEAAALVASCMRLDMQARPEKFFIPLI